jgi:hypothetical protein
MEEKKWLLLAEEAPGPAGHRRRLARLWLTFDVMLYAAVHLHDEGPGMAETAASWDR